MRSMPGSTGTVKYYNSEKGFGFIKPDAGGKDLFVHATALKQNGIEELAEGDQVAFEIDPNPNGKGPRAVNVTMAH